MVVSCPFAPMTWQVTDSSPPPSSTDMYSQRCWPAYRKMSPTSWCVAESRLAEVSGTDTAGEEDGDVATPMPQPPRPEATTATPAAAAAGARRTRRGLPGPAGTAPDEASPGRR